MKMGLRSIGVVIQELAIEAKREALLTLFTPGSTAEPAKDLIKKLLDKDVVVRIIINDWKSQPKYLKQTLLSMKSENPEGLRLYDFRVEKGCSLHAKAFVVDKRKAVVGSSNLSWSGMYSNYELAILLEGKDAENIAQLLNILIRSPLCREIEPTGLHPE
jgi:phosphatidylserine/phosphatidylglycerophosphate/cardiolipin synthase-like enzyme